MASVAASPQPIGPKVAQIARTWEGARFLQNGRSRAGVDCVGLVICVYAEAGVTLPDPPHAFTVSAASTIAFEQAIAAHFDLVAGDWQPGDVLQMDFQQNLAHVAIFIDDGVMAQAWNRARYRPETRVGTVVLCSIDPTMRKRIVKAWRLKA